MLELNALIFLFLFCLVNKYPDKCEKCNYEPTSNASYKKQKLIFHSSKKDKKINFKFYCEKCDFGTYAESLYKNHKNTIG
jgi:hypothetical protein